MISLFLLILTLIVLMVGNYQGKLSPEANWIGIAVILVLLAVFSQLNPNQISPPPWAHEGFVDALDKSNSDRKVCFGDTIILWSFNNTPIRFTDGGTIDLGAQLTKPS